MGIKRTILSGFALIALIAIYAADGSRRDAAEHKRLAATKLMNAEASQINHIVIKKLGGDIELAKEGDAWKLIRPIQAAADQETAQSLAELIAKQERIGAQKANPAEMEKMGLAKPAITLTAQASGPPITLMIGEDTPVQGEVYAQLADGEYFTVAAALRDQAARSLYDFRDKRLIHVEAKDATALAITLAGKTVEAVKRDGQWKLQKPIASDADNQKVDDLLGELQMTRPVEFITTATITLQQFGLEAPEIAVILTAAKGGHDEQGTLLIGHRRLGDQPSYYAMRGGDPNTIFTVPQSLYAKLQVGASDLRGKKLFSLTADQIRQLRLDFASQPILLVKDAAGRWSFQDDPKAGVDQDFVTGIITRLLKLQVAEYLSLPPTSEQSGLNDPFVRVIAADESGARSEGIETGRPVAEKDQVYARKASLNQGNIVASGEVFTVDADQPGRFFLKREAFLDKTLFAFKPETVAAFTVSTQGKNLLFQKEGDVWVAGLQGGKDFFQVKSELAERFILTFLSLKWKRALDPADAADAKLIETHHLKDPQGVFMFFDDSNHELARMAQGGTDETKVYVRRGDSEFFALDKAAYAPFILGLKDLSGQK